MMEAIWIGLAVATLVPAVLTAAVPRRRILPSLGAWFLSPVVVYAALIAWETLTHPNGGNRPGAALYGFALITPILAPFWLMAFLLGLALGAAVRALLRPRRARPIPASAPSSSPPWHPHPGPPLAPTTPQPTGPSPWAAWRAALLIAASAGVAIVAATVLTVRSEAPGSSPVSTVSPFEAARPR